MNTCRFCHKQEFQPKLLFKYGTRHYAHAECGFQKFGEQFMDMIPKHQIGSLPYFVLLRRGLLDAAQSRVSQS